jgi:surface polysaccharide O-acyltransferase-like enzyme
MFNLVVNILTVVLWVYIAITVNSIYKKSKDCYSVEQLRRYVSGLMTEYWFVFVVLMLNLISNIILAVGRL